MKDRQVYNAGPQPGIPLVSPVLHCIAMTGIVFLRSSFGFAFLSPKSVFIAFGWAMILFSIYAWIEPGVWAENGGFVIFGLGATALYFFHLVIAFIGELRRKSEHDFYSGTSHLSRFPALKNQVVIQLWIEPAIVGFAALVMTTVSPQHWLGLWLFGTAAALWTKEFINYWYHLRRTKKQEDVFSDAEDSLEQTFTAQMRTSPPGAGLKTRIRRPRATLSEGNEAEHRHAECLQLIPPYSLAQAEENFRKLIMEAHPDHNEASLESNRAAANLNEALEFFRRKLD